MKELFDFQTAIDAVLTLQKEQGYSVSTIKVHKMVYRGLLKFMRANNYTILNEEIGLEYVRNRSGTTMKGFYGSGNRKTNVYMKPVHNLLKYMKNGNLSYYMRPKLSEFQCPGNFEEEYLLFQNTYDERHYADSTITNNNLILHKFLNS